VIRHNVSRIWTLSIGFSGAAKACQSQRIWRMRAVKDGLSSGSWSWIDSSRKREALTISCPGPGIASLRRRKAGPGQKIAKTTPCKVEWTPARSTLTALRPGQEKKGPNLISSRSGAFCSAFTLYVHAGICRIPTRWRGIIFARSWLFEYRLPYIA